MLLLHQQASMESNHYHHPTPPLDLYHQYSASYYDCPDIIPTPSPQSPHPRPSLRAVAFVVIASSRLRSSLHRFSHQHSLPSPLTRFRATTYLLLATGRLKRLRKLHAQRVKALSLLKKQPTGKQQRPLRFIIRSRLLAIAFIATLKSRLDLTHSLFLPCNTALSLISDSSKLKLENVLNSGKCKVLQDVFSIVGIYLNVLKFIVESVCIESSQNKGTHQGLSGCYYALKQLCRVLWQGKKVMKICTGDMLSPRVFTRFESVKTFECLITDVDRCFKMLVTKVEDFVQSNYPTLNICQKDMMPLSLSGQYLTCLLQVHADKDRTQVLSKLQNHTKSYWPDFMSTWKKKLSAVEEDTLIQLMSHRLAWWDSQTYQDNIVLQHGFYVDRRYVKTVRALGSGSYGTVHEVFCFGQKYAMKTIRGTSNVQFVNEAAIQARLQHPHIVKLIWYSSNVEIEDSLSLLMELMDMDLDTFLRQKVHGKKISPLNCSLVAVDIMLQIAEAMKYLHEQGIMHRDLKSANVLVDLNRSPDAFTEGYIHVKLADFGLAKVKEVGVGQMINTAKVGTRYWRAPEVFWLEGREETQVGEERAIYSFSADVYGFAMTCYEILTCKTPFADCSKNGLKEKIAKLNERPVLPENVHPKLCDLISRCWDGNPQNRPSFERICLELEGIKNQFLFG